MDELKYNKLDKILPKYVKKLNPKYLSMEEWSYLKILYKGLGFEGFLKISTFIDRSYLERLRGDEDYVTGKNDMLRKHFESHLLKIATGKIKFV